MLKAVWTLLGRVLSVLLGLGAAAVVLTFGLVVTTSLLLRFAWRRSRSNRISSQRPRRAGGPRGEVIDVEVREIPAR